MSLVQYLVFGGVSIVVAVLSAFVVLVFNPVVTFSMVFAAPAVRWFDRMPPLHGWSGIGPAMKIGALWPLTLAPLHYLNFQVLEWSNWGYFGLFCAASWLIAFFVMLAGSSELDLSKRPTGRLARSYRKLRRKSRDGSAERWPEWKRRMTFEWGGKLSGMMRELGERIGAAHFTESKTVRLMGAPDEIEAKDGARRLIYFWEGKGLYLYFTIQDGKVAESKWYTG